MSRYLLDTDVLIDFSKGYEPVRSRVLAMIDGGLEVGICAVNVAEFCSGVPPERLSIWIRFFDALEYWDVPLSAAVKAGLDRYTLARSGQVLSPADLLIAAAARYHGAVVVTRNVKHYPMDDVEAMNPLQVQIS